MTRDEIEQKLWADQYHWGIIESEDRSIAGEAADAAVAEFRKRYPVEPDAPEPTAPGLTWYDEPPFEKDGESRSCWIAGEPFACAVYWSGLEWRVYVAGDSHVHGLRGRRVSPITKPPEPAT